MTTRTPALLLVAHPGHELLLYGWVKKNRPRVCILTDGSGRESRSRLDQTAELLASLGAERGPVFGRSTDREMYERLLSGAEEWIAAVTEEIVDDIRGHGTTTVVTDAMEGFNPVHDLCRAIAGAACAATGIQPHYEYPVYHGPRAFARVPDAIHSDLDDETLQEKLARGWQMSARIPDIVDMLGRYEAGWFRRESLRSIGDWAASEWSDDQPPAYETIGADRVERGAYQRVIRYREHVWPVFERLRQAVACASF